MEGRIIRKLGKTNKQQGEILLSIRELLRKREEQKRKVEQSIGVKESKYAFYDDVLKEKEVAEDSIIKILEEKTGELKKLNQKQKKLIGKLRKKNEIDAMQQAEEQRSVEMNNKVSREIKKFFQRAGEVVLKSLPKLLNTVVTLMIGKLFSTNRRWKQKGAVA